MRLGIADPSSSNYLNKEVFINNVKLVSINSGTERAVAVALVDANGNQITTISTKTTLTASSPTAASVGVASAQAVASNTSRRGLVLVNTSSNTISFGIGATAVLNSGITLTPGGVWEMGEYTYSTGAINAIASAAASNLSIQEWTS